MSEQLKHDPMGPSNLERRLNCPASLRLEEGLPEQASEWAEDGDDLHDLVARWIAAAAKPMRDEVEAEIDVLDAEAKAAVLYCLDAFAVELRTFDVLPLVEAEHRLDLSTIGCGFGTADVAIAEQWQKATVIDWKFGYLPVPAAAENLQLAAYAIGAAEEYEVSQVAVLIVQPYLHSISRHLFTADELAALRQRIQGIVAGCRREDAPLASGPWCKYCRAAASCPALVAQTTEIARIEKADQLSGQTLAKVLDLIERAEPIIKAAKTRAHAILESGGSVPGWGLVEGRKSRGWGNGATVVAELTALAAKLKKPDAAITRTEVASPAQIEAAWGKSKAVLAGLAPLISSKPGAMKLSRTAERNA